MSEPRKVKTTNDAWPPRPAGEVFPEVMNSTDAAQFLRYDSKPSCTAEHGRRMVRLLVRDHGLPVLSRIGGKMLFAKTAVLTWLATRGADLADPGAPVADEEAA